MWIRKHRKEDKEEEGKTRKEERRSLLTVAGLNFEMEDHMYYLSWTIKQGVNVNTCTPQVPEGYHKKERTEGGAFTWLQ